MSGPPSAVAAVRRAVATDLLDALGSSRGVHAPERTDASSNEGPPPLVLVACSGGADSLALAAALAFCAEKSHRLAGRRIRAGAVIIDHGWAADSATIAADVADTCRALGLDPVEAIRVQCAATGGPEAAARTARYDALGEAADRHGALAVLLGHTLDDQAETVLMGLARGAGARSLAGMPRRRGVFRRPLLDLRRADTEAACRALGLTPWNDPANADPRYLRTRARAHLPLLDAALGPGITPALARTAAMLAEDAAALDHYAERELDRLRSLASERPNGGPGSGTELTVSDLAELPDAVRRRVLRLAAIAAGAPPGSLKRTHVLALDALITHWRGQGSVSLPGGVEGRRRCGRLALTQIKDNPGTVPCAGADAKE